MPPNGFIRILAGPLGFRRDHMRQAIPDLEIDAAGLAVPRLFPCASRSRRCPLACRRDRGARRLPIVTANLHDFRDEELAPFGLSAIHPYKFIVAQLDLDLISALNAFKAMR